MPRNIMEERRQRELDKKNPKHKFSFEVISTKREAEALKSYLEMNRIKFKTISGMEEVDKTDDRK